MTEEGLSQAYLSWPTYGLDRAAKRSLLAKRLCWLTDLHRRNCAEYRAIVANAIQSAACELEDIPFLPVRLFKHYDLRSVPADSVIKILTSSGTTSQVPSRIYLDRENARAQSVALAKIVQDFIGVNRRPMLIIDSVSTISSRSSFTARAAGIVGLSIFGYDHTYALDREMRLDLDAVHAFIERHADEPVLVIGFTFMIWEHLVRALEKLGSAVSLRHATLLHSGGWKKLLDQSVDDTEFRIRLDKATGIASVHNYYGMVEQIGSVFVACDQGVLHAPSFADVIVRNPRDWKVCDHGTEGIIQVLSALPTSYPGHSLLTEDVGTILGEDDCTCGRKGKYFTVRGRIPSVEARGCSDTYEQGRPA